jgi:hypothetical protein
MAAVVNAQQTGPSPSGVTLPSNNQSQPPVSSLPACSNGADDDGDGLTDLADPGCSGPLDNDESDPTTPPPSGGGTGGTGGGTGGGGTGGGYTGGGGGSGPGPGGSGGHGAAGGAANGSGGASAGSGGQRATGGQRPPRAPNGVPTKTNPTLTIANAAPAPLGVPSFLIDQFTIPPFLLPIYQACGTQYGIPWEVLAGINRIETAFGTNLNVSSAGAVGWMQFIPSTWKTYGVDANGDGQKDPYNPVDAICAAARYLNAAGGENNLRRAIFAYNHADWYVDEVLLYAGQYGKLPDGLVGSLTGLTQGDRFPVAANARYADDISERAAARYAKRTKGSAGNIAEVVSSSPTRRGINIYSHRGAPVVAVNDGTIRRVGHNRKLGNYIVLQDTYGNRFTYAQLGHIQKTYPVPKRHKLSGSDFKIVTPKDKAPTQPATRGKPLGAKAGGGGSGEAGQKSAQPKTTRADIGGQVDQLLSRKLPGYSTFRSYVGGALPSSRNSMDRRPLRKGATVTGGTVLGRIGKTTKLAPHLNFAIQPAGKGAPKIDPKPILDGWKLLEATAIYRAADQDPFAHRNGTSTVIQDLLMSKTSLERKVLADPRLSIYACGRNDVRTGQIDRPVLATMEYLADNGFRLTITSLKCGHKRLTSSGSGQATGDAMDIAKINGLPVAGNQGPGTVTHALLKTALKLQGVLQPDQVISHEDLPGPVSFALPHYGDHVHIAFSPLSGAGYQNPFVDWVEGRIDQGVDFVGTGPINAIGTARILQVGAPGWPNGGAGPAEQGVLYKLLDGPRAGQIIFVYEGITPTVRPGQTVLAGQQIGTFFDGSSIEIGFADAAGTPLSHAIYHEGMVTPWGRRMASFLHSIGVAGNANHRFNQLLKPGQWNRIISRIGRIRNPKVPTSPSRFSLPTGTHGQKAQSPKRTGGGN